MTADGCSRARGLQSPSWAFPGSLFCCTLGGQCSSSGGQTSIIAAFAPIVRIAGTADGRLACPVEVTRTHGCRYEYLCTLYVCSWRMCSVYLPQRRLDMIRMQ
ncbi:hypothetical protein V8C44DRAFT_344071 [Trichoderma aethiopicum]